MKRAIVLLALLGCEARREPAKAPTEPPAIARPLGVTNVILRMTNGWLKEDSPFVVVLTRPVEPAPDALALVDDSGAHIPGATTWLDRQVVAFYPNEPMAPGLDLHLLLAVQLHGKDGSTLGPSELATGSTRAIESSGGREDPQPMGDLTLRFDRAIPAADVELLGELRDNATGPIAFSARGVKNLVYLSAKTAFRPGARLTFGWKSGPIARTSAGHVHLEPFDVSVKVGLSFVVGDHEEHCRYMTSGANGVTVACKSDVVHLVFSAPLAKSELERHTHPTLAHATTGDLRGHRVEITLGKKPVAIELDAKLEDVFGQHRSSSSKLDIRRDD